MAPKTESRADQKDEVRCGGRTAEGVGCFKVVVEVIVRNVRGIAYFRSSAHRPQGDLEGSFNPDNFEPRF